MPNWAPKRFGLGQVPGLGAGVEEEVVSDLRMRTNPGAQRSGTVKVTRK
jgi:hypothetical protein